MIGLRSIRFETHCEHHIGRARIAYEASGRVVGISKLGPAVEAFAERSEIQPKMRAQIAHTLADVVKPHGVGVTIEASHHCISTRGVRKHDADMVTSRTLGYFRDNPITRQEFLAING